MRLQELLLQAKGGIGYVDLAARDPEGRVGAARLQQLAVNGMSNFPAPSTIAALAVICRVPQHVIVASCAESLGIPWERGSSSFARLLPENVDQMPREAVAALLTLIQLAADHGTTD